MEDIIADLNRLSPVGLSDQEAERLWAILDQHLVDYLRQPDPNYRSEDPTVQALAQVLYQISTSHPEQRKILNKQYMTLMNQYFREQRKRVLADELQMILKEIEIMKNQGLPTGHLYRRAYEIRDILQ